MSEPPPPVPNPGSIPAGPLWTALVVPPVLTVTGNFCCAALSKQTGGEMVLLVPVFTALAILFLCIPFHRAVRERFQGVSLVFLNLSYLLGEAIICLALWFGTCLLVL